MSEGRAYVEALVGDRWISCDACKAKVIKHGQNYSLRVVACSEHARGPIIGKVDFGDSVFMAGPYTLSEEDTVELWDDQADKDPRVKDYGPSDVLLDHEGTAPTKLKRSAKHVDDALTDITVRYFTDGKEKNKQNPDTCKYHKPVPVEIDGEAVRLRVMDSDKWPDKEALHTCDEPVPSWTKQHWAYKEKLVKEEKEQLRAKIARLCEWPYCGHTQRNVDLVWVDNQAFWKCGECGDE